MRYSHMLTLLSSPTCTRQVSSLVAEADTNRENVQHARTACLPLKYAGQRLLSVTVSPNRLTSVVSVVMERAIALARLTFII